MELTEKHNRLINEKSPYLLQHAHNPVDWFPWGEEAFAKAKQEDKPVFLSIGYSTCHWCHVMERESFEDAEVAEVLNRHFVSIKVDREERPDIDTIYMSVCQALTGHGGWPLTVFLTPAKKPFYAGTYFPKVSKRGLPGLLDILSQIAAAWQDKREALLESGEQITEVLKTRMFKHIQGTLSKEVLDEAYAYFAGAFDGQYGGFGNAPKFPTPHNLALLLRYWQLTGQEQALAMVEKTLESMYRGGIYDHIGFGFARYSTDRKWLVPHFEKMLYDNALLALIYGEAYQATKKPLYARVVDEVFTYVLREMTSPQGAFYAAQDADSEGEEGRFYVWTPEEVEEVLGPGPGKEFCSAFDITARGNFEGRSIPNLIEATAIPLLETARDQLYQARERRIHPYKDDKILTAWNGLMIAAFAFNSRVLGKKEYAQTAARAVDFLMQHLRRKDGRLLARFRDGEAAYPAYAEDYAFLVWGLIELYQSTFEPRYLQLALDFNADLLRYFWDDDHGGLYHYGHDAEQLISRPKELYDGAIPSANSVAAVNLIRLAHLTGRQDLAEKAEQLLHHFGGTVKRSPAAYTHFLQAFCLEQLQVTEVTIAGSLDSPDTQRLLEILNLGFNPQVLQSVKAPGKAGQELCRLAPAAAEKEMLDNTATAYVCRGFSCQKPVTSPAELAAMLQRQ